MLSTGRQTAGGALAIFENDKTVAARIANDLHLIDLSILFEILSEAVDSVMIVMNTCRQQRFQLAAPLEIFLSVMWNSSQQIESN